MTDWQDWFKENSFLPPNAVVATGTIRVHEEVFDTGIVVMDWSNDAAGMLVAHVDGFGRVIIDEVVTATRADPPVEAPK